MARMLRRKGRAVCSREDETAVVLLESSDDLSLWTPVPAPLVPLLQLGTEWRRMETTLPVAPDGRRYYRARLLQQ